MGWMGDNTAFCQTGMYNMDMTAFYSKWLIDIRDAQAEDGSYPDYVPYPTSKIYNKIFKATCCPGWADCGIILPWTLYLNYGDIKILEEHYDSAKKFIDYVHERNPDLIWTNGIGANYGDWLNGDEFKIKDFPRKGSALPKDIYSTVYFAVSTHILSLMAERLERVDDFNFYDDLALKIKDKFNNEYVSEEGKIKGDTQAGYAFALYYNLLPKDIRPKAIDQMIAALEKLDNRISTGFMTTLPLMRTLAESGHTDIAYKLLFSRRVPSWFYMIDQGATTMWERWDGYIKGRGPQSSMMNSFNHFAIGSIGEWIYRVILGINLNIKSPGYKNIHIVPQPGGPLTWVKGSYNSIHGKIEVQWRLNDKRIELDITIPTNTTASVSIPATSLENIKESNETLQNNEFITAQGIENGIATILIKSGTYKFVN